MAKPSSASRRVKKVVAAIARDIGNEKVRTDIVEQELHSFDAFAAEVPSREPWPPYPRTAADRKAAREYGKAFVKLENWFARLENSRDAWSRLAILERAVWGELNEFFEWKAQLTYWRKRFEAFGEKDKSKPNLFFPKGDKSKSDRKFLLQRRAAAAAVTILRAHNCTLAATPKRIPSEASLLIRVAEFIAEGQNLKVEYECRKLARREPKTWGVGYRRESRKGPP
jgi:hypothetical protein